MKEASGELNMTVITVVAIAAIGAFFYIFVWPQLQGNITRSTMCSNVLSCEACGADNKASCQYQEYDKDGKPINGTKTITCPCNDSGEKE